MTTMRTTLCLFTILLSTGFVSAQKNFQRIFQFSLTPGISTNGIHPGGYSNFFSLNLTSGYSAANYLLEVGIVSNLNEIETRGLQIAGVSNVTGGNAFAGLLPKEIQKREREGFEANLSGLQLAGLANLVVDNVYGGQLSGGVNVGWGALQGVQIAGLSNTVLKYSFGVQLAGLYNVSVESMDGIQIAGGFNITTGGLYGLQLGVFNKVGFTEGINSFGTEDPFGVQVGLVNIGGKVNGYQIGLVNIGKRMQGTQIGIVNIFRNGKTPETRDGTSLGLINIGSSGYFSVYTNDIFFTTVELATGTVKNRRMNGDMKEKQIQNSLIYANDARFISDHEQWAIGYGVKKMFFNKSITPGFSRFRFFSFGIDLLHISSEAKKITRELSLLTRPNFLLGSRLHPKNKVFFLFAGLSYNFYQSDTQRVVRSVFSNNEGRRSSHWPGYSFGVLIQ